ncbi:MAG: redoxin domain-containing protein [Isosphaeraceae bacterium]
MTRRTELDRLESVSPYDGSLHRRCDPVLADVMYSCLERDGLDAGTRRPIDESRYWTETVSVRVSSSGGPLMNRALLCLLGCAAAFAEVQGDEPTATDAPGRIVEGKVVAAGQKPVEGARVLFGEHEVGMALVEGETATTDAQGRYRADLVKFPWSKGTVRALVLAPGYKAADGKIEAGTGPATADFELAAEPWIETRIRMADRSGRPVAGAVITCSVGRVIWARLKTDALGCCQIAMARYVGMRLSTEPKDARPIEARLSGTNNPASITLPVLPAIRGRVLDHQGWPVANAAVGRWLTFDSDGTGEMLPFLEFILGVTDRNGNFEIAPRLQLSFGVSRPTPNLEALCFADPSYRSMCYQLFKTNQPIRMAWQLLDPKKPVELLIVTLKPSRRVRIPISRGFVTSKRETQLYSRISIPKWGLLLNRDTKPGGSPTQPPETVLEEYLPEGTYHIEVSLSDAKSNEGLGEAQREFVVPRGDGALDLPPLALEQPGFQKMTGKPAPEIDATDLDTGRPVKLADFRGKVVVLEFWGYWCGPCNVNMPRLVELKRKFEGRPLVILALHDQSVQSRAVYDRKIAAVRERLWSGRDLPFRVLLDRPDSKKPEDRNPEGTGTTVERYGINGFPTLFVIDRDGTMIRQVAPEHNRLESLVRQQVEKAELLH